MRKKVLNIIEIILILTILLVCIVAILQSKFFQNKEIFGYQTHVITSNNMYPTLKDGDIILVKEITFNNIKKGNIITYLDKKEKNKIITNEVIDIVEENGTKVLKIKGNANSTVDTYVHKDQVCGIFLYKFVLISVISKIIKHQVGFVICILTPFLMLLILELIKFTKEVKRKKLENTMKLQLEELKNINDKTDLSKAIESTINEQIKEIKNAKRDFKKINELEETIRMPLEEIQKQLRELNKEKKEEDIQDNTVILFTKDELKTAIEKELATSKNTSKNNNKKKK